MRSLFGSSSSEMWRFRLLASLGGLTLCGGVALAEEPIASGEPVAAPSVVTQSTTTTITTTNPPATDLPAPPAVTAAPPVAPAPPAMAAPPAPPAMAAPPAPPAMPPPSVTMAPPLPPAPPSTTGAFQGPVYYNGPVWIIPAPASAQPYALPPPPLPPPPVYMGPMAPPVYAPPPLYRPPFYYRPRVRPPIYAPLPTYRPPLVVRKPPPRGPVFAIGARFTALGVSSQQVFGQNVNLLGGGVFMRFRNQGRFGFELGMDFLHTSIGNDAYVRNSYPFTVAPMVYLFQNRPDSHFNIYAIGGFGLMADDIGLYKGTSQERNQRFWELMGQGGGGIELRFHRLALFADARAVGMLLDDSSAAGVFYQNVTSGPIASSSVGYKVHAGALLWF